jgi:hypothetical protein
MTEGSVSETINLPTRSTQHPVSMLTLLLNSPWLFVDGLPLYYTADDITELFSRFGTVQVVRLQHDRTGMSLRCAYIQMTSHADAERAILLANSSGKDLRAIHIDPPF